MEMMLTFHVINAVFISDNFLIHYFTDHPFVMICGFSNIISGGDSGDRIKGGE